MNMKPTVTIGIPAYNESHNISRLLSILLKQKQAIFSLEEILVVCDGCTDNTETIVRSINYTRINVIVNEKRLGQQVCQNDIVKMYRGDILILLEADTLPVDADSIGGLIKLMILFSDQSYPCMVVGATHVLTPASFFDHILFFGSKLKQRIFTEWKEGINIYTYNGQSGRALNRAFTNKLKWPVDVPEDAYAYLQLKAYNGILKRVSSAGFYSRNVRTVSDRKKQVERFLSGKKSLEKYFNKDIVDEEYGIPKILVMKHVLLAFLHTPFWTVAYLVELFLNRLYSVQKSTFQSLSEPAYSTKSLKINSEN